MNRKILILTACLAYAAIFVAPECLAQIQTGVWRTPSNNTDYHHFTRNGGGAAVYINQESTAANHPILRLSSGSAGANTNVRFTVENSGNVGIGTTSPTYKLHVVGSGKWTGNESSYTEINSNTGGQYIRQFANDGTTQSWLIRGYAYNGVQAIFNEGGINVNGTIYTKEVNVKANAAEFPDYVFEEGYPLQDLETLKAYIQKEKHLPGVPTSAEVGKSGINLYEMNIKLLEKIEELTLYTIAQEEQLKIKQEQFSLLEERLSKLERMLDPKNEE